MSRVEICACSHSAGAHQAINGETRCYGMVRVAGLPGEPSQPGPCDCRELRTHATEELLWTLPGSTEREDIPEMLRDRWEWCDGVTFGNKGDEQLLCTVCRQWVSTEVADAGEGGQGQHIGGIATVRHLRRKPIVVSGAPAAPGGPPDG